jgi:hypothetical protein
MRPIKARHIMFPRDVVCMVFVDFFQDRFDKQWDVGEGIVPLPRRNVDALSAIASIS